MPQVLLNNRYQILQALGKGGFGHTFLALDTHMPSERRCVIKQLKPVLLEPEKYSWVQERFSREAAILEQLGQGNDQIPQLYGYFSEAETFYLVQEWIEGITLKQKQQQNGPLPAEQVRDILVSLLSVLDYIHTHRIVHRDIKPDNIILRRLDEKPVLIDFGVVKEAMGTGLISTGNTTISMAIGTPGFMPPEQAAGRPVYSSDLCSLGLTAIYLLTGKVPQELETDPGTGEFLWSDKINNLDFNLATVIDQAIRFHPRDRFSTAAEMLEALQDQKVVAVTTATVKENNFSAQTAAKEAIALTDVVTKDVPDTGNPVSLLTEAKEVVTKPASLTWRKKIVTGALCLAGVLVAGSFGFSLSVMKKASEKPLSVASQPDQSLLESPTSEPSSSSTELPEPEDLPTPNFSPLPPSSPLPTISFRRQATPSPTPSPTRFFSSSTPIPPVPPATEKTKIENKNSPLKEKSQVNLPNFPSFALGTSENRVKKALGKPTSIHNGYWRNTQELIYEDFFQDQINLSYIIDNKTKLLRQVGVSFPQSANLAVMEKTLERLGGGKVPASAKQGLQQVYQRRTNLRAFSVGRLKGIIRRNSSDRIYIGVGEADSSN